MALDIFPRLGLKWEERMWINIDSTFIICQKKKKKPGQAPLPEQFKYWIGTQHLSGLSKFRLKAIKESRGVPEISSLFVHSL